MSYTNQNNTLRKTTTFNIHTSDNFVENKTTQEVHSADQITRNNKTNNITEVTEQTNTNYNPNPSKHHYKMITGTDGDDILTGSSSWWSLGGNDTFDGGKGADTYDAKGSNNTVYIDNINDVVRSAGSGTKFIVSVDNYSLPKFIESGSVSYTDGAKPLEYFIDALDSGSREGFLAKDKGVWQGYGTGIVVKYAFATRADGGERDFKLFSKNQQDDIGVALSEFGKVADVRFEKVDNPNQADFKIYLDNLISGIGYHPKLSKVLAYSDIGGNMHLNTAMHNFDRAFEKNDNAHFGKDNQAGMGYDTVVHEAGHIIGMKHPFDKGLTLSEEEDNYNFTTMSYSKPDNFDGKTFGLSPFDKATLHYRFGVNHKARTGDQTYNMNDEIYIWDGAGNDTITAEGATENAYINLNEGSWNYIGTKAEKLSADKQSFLGYDTQMENAIGGSGDDTITGNKLDNKLQGGAGNDSYVLVDGGHDTISDTQGTNTLTLNKSITRSDIKAQYTDDGVMLRYANNDKDSLLITDLQPNQATNYKLAIDGTTINLDDLDIVDNTTKEETDGNTDNSDTDNSDTDNSDTDNGSDRGNNTDDDTITVGGDDEDNTNNDDDDTITVGGDDEDNTNTDDDDTIIVGGDDEEDNTNNDDDDIFVGTVIDGDGSDEIIKGTADNEMINGFGGSDKLYGGEGDDELSGGEGSDYLFAGAGNDILTGDGGNDYLIAQLGNNTLNGGEGNDYLYAGKGTDILNGEKGSDRLYGGDGNDILSGGNDNDYLYGGKGADTLNGGADNDKLYAGEGDDTLNGGAGDDYLSGGKGNDSLKGGSGNDTLHAGDGNDSLYFSNGDNTLIGGDGADIFILDSNLSANSSNNISDFVSLSDVLQIDNQVFSELSEGRLSNSQFIANSGGIAQDGNDHILYNTDNGQLSYDADGSGAGQALVFATLENLPTLQATDIVVI